MFRSLLIVFFGLMLCLLFTQTTDADMIVSKEIQSNQLQATTLDFSNRDTASSTKTNLLFNISGIRPGGYQVRAIRVQKDGKMDFNYELSAEIKSGDSVFCNKLVLTILENWQKKYEGKLVETKMVREMGQSGQNDWVLVVQMPDNITDWQNKNCGFDLVFKTLGKGFNNESKVENQVSSGNM